MSRQVRRKLLREQAKRHFSSLRTVPWAVVGVLAASTAFGERRLDARERELVMLGGQHGRWFGSGAANPGATPAQAGSVQTQDAPAYPFAIAAGRVSTVLAELQRITGATILIPSEAAGELPSTGVSGLFTLQQALAQALTGTLLGFRVTGPNTILLEFRAEAASVDVVGTAPRSVASPKYASPILDTPQSVDVVSSALLADQGAVTLRDALRNVAGITLTAGEGGAQGDNFTVRGFGARTDIFIDGIRDFGNYYRDPFNQDEVEVLKGPSSVTFGRGSTGGVINQESKTPQLPALFAGAVNFGTNETRRVTIDVGQPLPEFGKGAALRLNVMAHDGGVAGRSAAENRRFGLAPSLALGMGTSTRTLVSYFHQSANDVPDYGIPWLYNAPAPVSRGAFYGFKDANFLRTNADIGTAKVEHDFNSAFRVTNQFRLAHYSRHLNVAEGRIASGSVPLGTPLDAILSPRLEIGVQSTEALGANQMDFTAHVTTGSVKHTIVTGFEAGHETSNPTRTNYTGVPAANMLHPDEDQPFSGTPVVATRVTTRATSLAAYALDTIAFGSRWEITGGVRWDSFDVSYEQSVAPVAAFERVDKMTSWRGAVVFKPSPTSSLYASSGNSFNPSAEALALSARTANTPPETNRTYEVGAKWDVPSLRLSLSTAAFRTDKNNAREPDPLNPLQNVLSGEQRVNGVEANVSGYITSRWKLFASGAYLDATLTKSVAFPAAIGAALANVPTHTLNIWSSYDLPWHVEVAGGTRYVGRRTASATVPLDPQTGLLKEVPGYWVSSAMAKRPLSPRLVLQLNIENIANVYYYDQLDPDFVLIGPGRSALVALNFKF